MIVILKRNASPHKVRALRASIEEKGMKIHESVGEHKTILGLVGDVSRIDIDTLSANDAVETVRRISEPYKLANRKFYDGDALLSVGGGAFGRGHFGVIAGPCSVESREQIVETARRVKQAGASFLRGGAFKPRTSPYSFRGLRAEGIELLLEAKKETGLPIITELTSLHHLPFFEEVDIIQVGARNMQNFEMLSELGKCGKPVLLKRGLSSTIEELLMSAEYILSGGNERVILCERGIRTFETATRNTLDLSAIPLLKTLTHLPVVADPSHAVGISQYVHPLAKAAVVAGADGLMIEVHPSPETALSDGAQSVTPDAFDSIMGSIRALCALEGKSL